MEWRDQGVLLAVRKHGENSAIIEVFTAEHGRHAGVVRGASSRKMTPVLQPGAQLDVTWRARLADHLGSYSVEPLRSRAAAVMGDRLTLSALNSICALLAFALPEREAHDALYQRSVTLFDLLGNTEGWPLAYLRWELALLEDLGFGLDLRRCAVNGSRDDLAYVSPKSGRAVSAEGAGEWADRLLPLPLCLLGQGPAPDSEIIDGLRLTGHFLTHWLAHSLGNKPLPAARQRFVDAYARHA
jgi:DNA repair protein RecO (recombination protein O)